MNSAFEKLFYELAKGAARTAPIMDRVFPETLEIDDNIALWSKLTRNYQPGASLQESITADVAIIGGGFTGTSTAYHLSRRFPNKRIVLLEAKSLANGASGRNGGMMLNWLPDMSECRTDECIKQVYDLTQEGMQTILGIIQRHNLDVSYRMDGSLETYTNTERAESAHRHAEYLQSLDIPVQYLDKAALSQSINLHNTEGAVLDPNAGQINGAQYVRGLRPVLVEQGVEVYENTPVINVQEGQEITLTTPHAEVRAKAIVLATNGYVGKLGYFKDAVFPLHSHVFATVPLTHEQQHEIGWLKYSGFSDDYDRISYSVMTSEGNLVFGGGSNAAYAYLFRNRTAYPGTPMKAQQKFAKMKETLHTYLPKVLRYQIPHQWTGTLGITLRRNTLIGVRGEHRNVYYAVGFCGHGVTLANLAGKILTDIYSEDDTRWRDMPFYQSEYSPIPPEPFRWLGYNLFTRLTGKSPRQY